MKNFLTYTTGLTLLLVGTILGAVIKSAKEQHERNQISLDSSFVVENGPEKIGFSLFRVVRHEKSGHRFVYIERDGGGMFLHTLIDFSKGSNEHRWQWFTPLTNNQTVEIPLN